MFILISKIDVLERINIMYHHYHHMIVPLQQMIVLVFISCRPVDLLSDDRLTYAYAAAFGCTSSFILQLILSVDTDSFNVSPDVKPWIQS